MHPVIETAIATQRIREMQADATRTAQARAARRGRSPRLAWLFDLAGRREAARLAQSSPDACCPDYLLTGQCSAHAQPGQMTVGSRAS